MNSLWWTVFSNTSADKTVDDVTKKLRFLSSYSSCINPLSANTSPNPTAWSQTSFPEGLSTLGLPSFSFHLIECLYLSLYAI